MAGYNSDLHINKVVPRLQTEQKDNDPVNSPSHYTDGGIETIDFIEAKKLNYNLGNAVKYIARAGKKSRFGNREIITPLDRDNSRKEDLEKAVWYMQREIKTLKGK